MRSATSRQSTVGGLNPQSLIQAPRVPGCPGARVRARQSPESRAASPEPCPGARCGRARGPSRARVPGAARCGEPRVPSGESRALPGARVRASQRPESCPGARVPGAARCGEPRVPSGESRALPGCPGAGEAEPGAPGGEPRAPGGEPRAPGGEPRVPSGESRALPGCPGAGEAEPRAPIPDPDSDQSSADRFRPTSQAIPMLRM
jgi:hypothetical protein